MDSSLEDICEYDESFRRLNNGCLEIKAFFLSTKCKIPDGTCFFTPVQPVDARGHFVDNEDENLLMCKHAKPFFTESFSVESSLQETSMDPKEETTHELEQLVETVGVPSSAVNDIKQLMPADGDASIFTVLLAFIGVAGGGTAFKFYQQRARLQHEVRLKELDKQSEGHAHCAAERALLEEKLASVEKALKEISQKDSDSLLPDIDFIEMKGRLDALEKAVQPKEAPKKRGRPPKASKEA